MNSSTRCEEIFCAFVCVREFWRFRDVEEKRSYRDGQTDRETRERERERERVLVLLVRTPL
jgi:hypothetical protein